MRPSVVLLLLVAASACSADKDSPDSSSGDDTAADGGGGDDTAGGGDSAGGGDTAGGDDTGGEDTGGGDSGGCDTGPPAYSIEDRWVLPELNTMYAFDGSVRRTFYCVSDTGEPCDDAYWASLTLADAIPGENVYTFDGETLTIDLNHGHVFEETVTFECDGGRLAFDSSEWFWVRLGAELEGCED